MTQEVSQTVVSFRGGPSVDGECYEVCLYDLSASRTSSALVEPRDPT